MKRTVVLFSLIGLFIIACAFLFYPDYQSPRIVKFLIISQVLLLLSMGIFWLGRRFDFAGDHRRLFLVILALALVARILMWGGAGDKLFLSNDAYRYLWDGKVNAHGINPFRYEPPAPELEHLRDSTLYPNINHPWLPTIYPPMAQNIFLVSYLIGGDSIRAFKLFSILFELLTLVALLVWLGMSNISRANMLLYLFSPLILIEFYLSAHLDVLAMPFLITALIAAERRRPEVSGLLLACATLVKFYGLFFLPFMFFHIKGSKKWLFAVAFTAAVAALYLPYLPGSDGQFLGSLIDYVEEWQYNASVFFVLKYVFVIESARYIVAALFIIWLVIVLVRRHRLYEKLLRAFGGYVVLTPTLFPWYLVWILPIAVRNLSWAFLVLSGTVLLSYHVLIGYYRDGTWTPIIWLGVASYVPFYGILIWSWLRRLSRKHRDA